MQREAPLLTIAIPTYNRSRYLHQLLSALAPQLMNTPSVELIISDNASQDNTGVVVDDFQKRGLRLIYIRNETNVDADANFLQCFERAKGEYVWIFGDDDVIVPGAIHRILSLVGANDYDLVFVAPYIYRKDYLGERPSTLRSRAPLEIANSARFVHRVNRHGDLIFISTLIVNKETVARSAHAPFSILVGTNLVQLGWAFTALKNFRRGLIIDEHLVAGLAGGPVSWDSGRIFGQNLYNVATKWLGPESEITTVILNDLLSIWFPANWLRFRSTAATDLEREQLFRSLFGKNFRYWLYAYPLVTMPMPVAKIWCECVRLPNKFARVLLRVF